MLTKQYWIKNFSRGLTILTLFRLHRLSTVHSFQSNQFLAYSACIFCVSSVKITWLAVYRTTHSTKNKVRTSCDFDASGIFLTLFRLPQLSTVHSFQSNQFRAYSACVFCVSSVTSQFRQSITYNSTVTGSMANTLTCFVCINGWNAVVSDAWYQNFGSNWNDRSSYQY